MALLLPLPPCARTQSLAVPVVGNTPYMIFGADVTHPTSFNQADPSIAAVCATVDRSLGRFITRVLKQVSGYV